MVSVQKKGKLVGLDWHTTNHNQSEIQVTMFYFCTNESDWLKTESMVCDNLRHLLNYYSFRAVEF